MQPLITTALLVAVFITGCEQSSPLSQAEIEAIQDDLAVEKASNTNDFSAITPKELNCEKICDPNNPDYRCLFSGSLGTDRDKQMMEMISKISAPQPVHLSHAEILTIFKLNGSGFDYARGETLIESDILTNTGTASEISSNTTTGLSVALTVPKTVEYNFKQSKSGFTLSSRNDNLFSIHIDDPILQRQYGGAAKLISVEPNLTVISTDRGCIAYDPAPQLAGGKIAMLFARTMARRIEVERKAGATEERISRVKAAYVKATLLRAEPCTIEQCGSCPSGENMCKTELGDACMQASDCIKYHGRICGT